MFIYYLELYVYNQLLQPDLGFEQQPLMICLVLLMEFDA